MNLSKSSKWYLIFVFLFFLSSFFWVPHLKFDYRFENFYPEGKNLLDEYENFTKNFEVENDFILVGMESEGSIFDREFLKKTVKLTKKLKQIEHVKNVLSALTVKKWNTDGLIPYAVPLIRWSDSIDTEAEAGRFKSNYSVFNQLVSADFKSMILFIKTDENLSKVKSDSLAEQIRRASYEYFPKNRLHFTGRAIIQKSYLEELQKEFSMFVFLSAFMVFAGVYLIYRSIKISWLLVVHLFFIMLCFFAVFPLTGKKIDILSVMYPPLVFILGGAHAIHYLNAYIRLSVQQGTLPIDKRVCNDIGYASRMAALTTSIGFISFIITPIGPLRSFGLYAAFLSALSYALTFRFMPLWIQTFRITASRISLRPLLGLPAGFYDWILKNKKLIYVFFVSVAMLSFIPAALNKKSHVLLEDLSEKLEVKKDLMFFEENFYGIRPLEIIVKPKRFNNSNYNDSNMNDLLLIHYVIDQVYKPGLLLSPVSVAEELNNQKLSASNFGIFKDFLKVERKAIKSIMESKNASVFFNKKENIFRFSGKLPDEQSSIIKIKNERFLEWMNKTGLDKSYEIKITGSADLIDKNHEVLVESSFQSFLLSLGVIFLLSLFHYKKWKMFLIFIVPNILPLLIIFGMLPLLGQTLKASTAMLFSVAIGIVVDDTFHFVGKYFHLRQKNYSVPECIRLTLLTVGNSMILTSFILILGFASLVLSSFTSLAIFGLLMSLCVVFAILCDLILLPLLFYDFGNDKPIFNRAHV
jgi:predicted RND superfamily exporter protein